MWCGRRLVLNMQIHTVVEQPTPMNPRGRISCMPMGQEPIEFTWMPCGAPMPDLDETRSEATNVAPGRYRIRAVDACGNRGEVMVEIIDLREENAITITGYDVEDATGTWRMMEASGRPGTDSTTSTSSGRTGRRRRVRSSATYHRVVTRVPRSE